MKGIIDSEERRNAFEEMELEEVGRGVFQAGMGFLTAMAGLIGVWGLACFLGAVTQAGLLEVVRGWVTAVTGM
jgi:hypothetical protein